MSAFGVYLHVPFCSALCPYCDFAVVVGRADVHSRYMEAVVDEARAHHWGAQAATLFVGGGTPSFVDPGLLARTVVSLRELISFVPDAEMTIEANPESVTLEALRELRSAGVNRVSIGAQAFNDEILKSLGRTHAAADIGRAVSAARAVGIANISLDLIYGGFGETDDDWRASLDSAIALNVDHLSCYALTIEERTPFGKAVARKTMRAPDEDALADRYDLARTALRDAGYTHYELSNWARPGSESKHNLVYWTQGDYLGLGLGAHSHREGHRWWNTRALTRYLDDPANAKEDEEHLSDTQRAEEWLTLQLRLVAGIDLGDAATRLGRELATKQLEQDDLVHVENGRLELTPRGMLLENRVALELLG